MQNVINTIWHKIYKLKRDQDNYKKLNFPHKLLTEIENEIQEHELAIQLLTNKN